MNYEKYLVKKGKTDLLSSLKALDKKVLNEKMKDLHVKDINELKDAIIKKFAFILNLAKDDVPTIMYFERLLEHVFNIPANFWINLESNYRNITKTLNNSLESV